MQRLEPVYAAALLALNIVELAGLLFFTGGLQNPFSFLFLAPVLISATALPIRLTIALGVLAVACASVLVFFHLPLPWDSDDPLVLPPIYLFGVWLSIVVAIGVTSLYAFQVTEEARKLSDALAATELVLTREQHLTQLDGLAAAAAHELGTPLVDDLPDFARTGEGPAGQRPAGRRHQDLARTGAALPRHSGQDHATVGDRRAVRPHAAVDADRGNRGAASRFRRHDQGPDRGGGRPRAGRHPQSGDPLWRRQHPGERRRFRAGDGGGQCVVEHRNRRDRHFRRRPRLRPRHPEADRRTLSVAAAQRDETQTGTAASVLGFLSPAPCSSAPAPRSPFPTGYFRTMAPWFRSPGPAAASRPAKFPPNRHLKAAAAFATDRLCAALAAPWCHAI